MANYSMDFLEEDWIGAGMDVGFSCLVDTNEVNLSKLLDLITRASKMFRPKKIGYLDHPDQSKLIQLPVEQMRESHFSLHDSLQSLPWLLEACFCDDIDPDLQFYMRFESPNHFEFSAAAEYYYSGAENEDRRRLNNLVTILMLCCEEIGCATCAFAADYVAGRIVQERYDSGQDPNMSVSTNVELLVNDILLELGKFRNMEKQIHARDVSLDCTGSYRVSRADMDKD